MFYKYRTDSKYTELIFTTGNVHLSTAAALNDPFECSLQDIGKDWINEKITEMKHANVLGFVVEAKRTIKNNEMFYNLSPKETKNVIKKISKKKNLKESYKFFKKFITKTTGHPPSNCDKFFDNLDTQLNSVGIFSMSISPDHPLLWAHYSQNHEGICIGFSPMDGSKLNNSEHCLKVNYSDSIPKIDGNGFNASMEFSIDKALKPYVSNFKLAFTDKTFQAAMTTKPTDWSYEQEWRYVERSGGEFPWPGVISELTFGLKCPDERRHHYIDLVSRNVPNEVRLFEIQKLKGSNSLERFPYKIATTSPHMICDPNKPVLRQGRLVKPLSIEQFLHKMDSLIQKGEMEEALDDINANLKNNPDSPELLNIKALALGYSSQHLKALKIYKKLNQLFPNSAYGWYQEGVALIQLGKCKDAVKVLRKANSLDPHDSSIALNLGIVLHEIGEELEEAMIYLNNAKLLGHPKAEKFIQNLSEPK